MKANVSAPMPFSAASRIVSRRLQATHSGGCGFCTGLGTTLRGGIVHELAVDAGERCLGHAADRGLRDPPATRRASRNGSMPKPPSSASLDDSPLPNSTRPSETRSSMLTRSAVRAGWLNCGAVRMIPWPSRMFLRALAARGEEHLGRRRVAVLLEEVVLDLPHVLDAERVGELDLLERVLDQLVLGAVVPRTPDLVLVEDPELHRRS